MTHTEFFKAMKNGEFSPVYFFIGEEQYVLRSALKQLENTLVQPELRDLDLTLLSSESSCNEVADACDTVPFMSPKRVVVISDPVFLTRAENEGEEALCNYLKNPSDMTVLVVSCAACDKRRRLYKELSKHTVVEFNALSSRELEKWIEKTLNSFNISIASDALSFIIEYADARPEALICELEKLASYKKEGTVTKNDILTIVTPCNDYNIFKMTDAIIAGNKKVALELLSGMLAQREEPIYILAAISKQMRQLLRAKLLLEDKMPKAEIIKLLDVKDFVFYRLENNCKSIDSARLKSAVDLCYKTDQGLKTGEAFDEAALHALVLQLSLLKERKL